MGRLLASIVTGILVINILLVPSALAATAVVGVKPQTMQSLVTAVKKTATGAVVYVKYSNFKDFGSCMNLQKIWKDAAVKDPSLNAAIRTALEKYVKLSCGKNIGQEMDGKKITGSKPMLISAGQIIINNKTEMWTLSKVGKKKMPMSNLKAGNVVVGVVTKKIGRTFNGNIIMEVKPDYAGKQTPQSMMTAHMSRISTEPSGVGQ